MLNVCIEGLLSIFLFYKILFSLSKYNENEHIAIISRIMFNVSMRKIGTITRSAPLHI